MSKLTATEVRGMMEAYNAVYAPQQEVQELTLEIIENAAYVLFSQGYNVEDVISYFSEATEETIVEDFINFAEGNVILESVVVSDEYIEEQFIQLDEKFGGALKFLATQAGRAKQALAGVKQALTPAAKAPVKNYKSPLTTALSQGSKPAGATAAATAKPGLLQRAASGAKELLKKVPGAGLVSKIAKSPVGKLAGRIAPGAGVALGAMDAASRLKKGDIGGAALSGLGGALSAVPGGGTLAGLGVAGIQAATDAAGLTGDKSKKTPAVKTAPTGDKAKFNASAALGGKTAFKAGGGAAALKQDPKLTAADIQRRGTAALRSSAGGDLKKGAELFKAKQQIMAGKPTSTPAASAKPAPAAAAPAKPAPAAAAPEVRATNTLAARSTQPSVKPGSTSSKPPTGTLGSTSFERRTPTSAELKGAQEYRQQNPDAKPEDVLKAGQLRGRQQASVDADIAKFNKPQELNKPAPAGTALAAEQERRRKAAEQGKATAAPAAQTKPQPVNASYEYDAYDLVLEYLFSEGHVDTVDEAHYVMLEMDSDTIQSIIEGSYEDRIAANNKKYNAARKKAAQRAAARNAARDAGNTGAVPGVGYVTPRRERETYTDSAGVERGPSGARSR